MMRAYHKLYPRSKLKIIPDSHRPFHFKIFLKDELFLLLICNSPQYVTMEIKRNTKRLASR